MTENMSPRLTEKDECKHLVTNLNFLIFVSNALYVMFCSNYCASIKSWMNANV